MKPISDKDAINFANKVYELVKYAKCLGVFKTTLKWYIDEDWKKV